MLRAIEEVGQDVEDLTSEGFRQDGRTVRSVLWNLFVVGEAANALPDAVRARAPDVPWRSIRGFRNVLAHEYFGIDLDIVWATATDDLPRLSEALERLLAEAEDDWSLPPP